MNMKIQNSSAFGTLGGNGDDRRFTTFDEASEFKAVVNHPVAQRNGGDITAEEFAAMLREATAGSSQYKPRFKPLAVAIACCYPNVPKGIW